MNGSESDSTGVVAPDRRTLVLEAFCATHGRAWTAFARARGLTPRQAEAVTEALRERLAACLEEVMGTAVPAAEAWRYLKEEIAAAAFAAPPPGPLWKEAVRAALERMRINLGIWVDEYGTYEAILGLPERQQEVIVLRYMLDLPSATIAEYLDTTVENVTALAYRGRNRLEQKLRRRSGR
ncbi:sigma-70 family RNA polymerase sigma factor [Kitasatospora sp. NPDC088134]|uniref:sigma-70 family RNA polymerase sigma factor n=1 Tax=Kitasatospora sp. NPDC088134 TaxID=3364071 RepID=UPI00380676CD